MDLHDALEEYNNFISPVNEEDRVTSTEVKRFETKSNYYYDNQDLIVDESYNYVVRAIGTGKHGSGFSKVVRPKFHLQDLKSQQNLRQ